MTSEGQSGVSKRTSEVLRGTFALAVLFFHAWLFMGEGVSDSLILKLLIGNWGNLAVTGFFFISGYGLGYSFRNKEDYTKTFLAQRLVPVVVYLVFMLLVSTVWELIWMHSIQTQDTTGFLFSDLLYYAQFEMGWFFLPLIVFYAGFWLIAKFLDGRPAYFVLFVLAYIVICILLGTDEVYIVCAPGMAVGYAYAMNTEKLFEAVSYKKSPIRFVLILIVFVACYVLKIKKVIVMLFGESLDAGLLSLLFSLLFTTSFSLILISLAQLINGNDKPLSKAMSWLSAYSLGIYVSQDLLFNLARWGVLTGVAPYLIVTIFGTLVLAVPTQKAFLGIRAICSKCPLGANGRGTLPKMKNASTEKGSSSHE